MATDQGHARLPQAPFTQFGTAKSSSDALFRSKNERGYWMYPTRATPKPTLDFTQRLERKWAEYNASQNVVRRWLFEIISWLLSALCMGTMIGIYLRINRQALSNSDKLLTLANILGKVASAALIVPTSEALGQLKWNWFHESSQAVWDFEIFDKASRGPWGAALLLYRTKGRSLAALGALLIVLLLAVDSFFQQVVELPTRWTLQDTSVLPITIRYEPDVAKVYQEGAEMNVADKDMGLVVDKFSFANGTQPNVFGNGTRPEIPLSCPTSKCTWPVYNTLGVCSQCSDISEQLTFACLTTTIDWTVDLQGGYKVEGGYPMAAVCGYFLNATSEAPVLMSGYLVDSDEAGVMRPGETLLTRTMPLTTFYDFAPLYGNGSINYKHLRNTISDVLIVSAVNGSAEAVYGHTLPVAQECVLFWCVKSIRSTYDWGRYEEEVLESFTNSTPGPFPWISIPYQTNFSNGTDNYYLQDILIDVENASGNQSSTSHFGTSNGTALTMGQSFQDIFPSYTTIMENSTGPLLRYKTWLEAPPWSRVLEFNPWLAPNNVTRHMERLAMAMSNVIRSAPSRKMLDGDAWDKETFVFIQWAWLAFPITLLVLSLVFLVSTIVKTSKDEAGVWKTSAMPSLVYSLPKDTQKEFPSSTTWQSSPDKSSRNIKVRLLPKQGWRISGQPCTITAPAATKDKRPGPGWI